MDTSSETELIIKISEQLSNELDIKDKNISNILKNILKTTDTSLISTKNTIKNDKEKEKERHLCMYRMKTGANVGKICGTLEKNAKVEAKNILEGKYYCTPHYNSMLKKTNSTQTIKTKGIKNEITVVTTDEKVKIEKIQDIPVISGTLFTFDPDHNVITGKFPDENSDPTDKITKEDVEELEKLNIPYYRCINEDELKESNILDI